MKHSLFMFAAAHSACAASMAAFALPPSYRFTAIGYDRTISASQHKRVLFHATMVAPAQAAALGLGVGVSILTWLRQLNRYEEQAAILSSVQWTEAVDGLEDDDADACVLIGEEVAQEGRRWFACKHPPGDDSDMECTKNESIVADTWLCKEPKTKK